MYFESLSPLEYFDVKGYLSFIWVNSPGESGVQAADGHGEHQAGSAAVQTAAAGRLKEQVEKQPSKRAETKSLLTYTTTTTSSHQHYHHHHYTQY